MEDLHYSLSVKSHHVQALASEVATGLRSCFHGLALVVTTPKVLLCCLKHTPYAVFACLLVATLLWIVARPLTLVGFAVHFSSLLKTAVLFTLAAARLLLPHLSGPSFFAVFDACNPTFCRRLQGQPVLHGLWAGVRHLMFEAMLGVAACIILAILTMFCGHWLLLLAAGAIGAVSGFVAVWWTLIVPLTLVLGLTVAVCSACLRPLLSTLGVFKLVKANVDPVVAMIVSAVAILAMARRGDVISLATQGVYMYLAVVHLTQQLLTQYAIRQESAEWQKFTKRYRWQIFGFGLPFWLLAHWQPGLLVAVLEIGHGSAAKLLDDLLAGEPAERPGAGGTSKRKSGSSVEISDEKQDLSKKLRLDEPAVSKA